MSDKLMSDKLWCFKEIPNGFSRRIAQDAARLSKSVEYTSRRQVFFMLFDS